MEKMGGHKIHTSLKEFKDSLGERSVCDIEVKIRKEWIFNFRNRVEASLMLISSEEYS